MTDPVDITIGKHTIGPGHRPFIIAEVSGNHDGSLDKALDIVRMVADSGAQAVKLQTYKPETITIDSDAPDFRLSDGHELWGGRTLWDLYQEAHTPWEWHAPIFELANSLGLACFSSPFDPTAIDLLESLETPAYKIASSEIVDLPLIRLAASKGKPMIISTGMASISEIDAAVEAARSTGNDQIVVLSCTADYPANPEESNLRGIPVLRDAFGTHIGLSDHTPGIGAPLAAVALGAVAVEKHVTLAREGGGVDSSFSLEPAELASLARESEVAWQCLGQPRIGATSGEREGLRFRRSLYVVEDVRAGDRVTADNNHLLGANGFAERSGSLPDRLGLVASFGGAILGRGLGGSHFHFAATFFAGTLSRRIVFDFARESRADFGAFGFEAIDNVGHTCVRVCGKVLPCQFTFVGTPLLLLFSPFY